MTILSYLISVIIFFILDVITTSVVLGLTVILIALIFKVQDAPYRFSTQLIGAYFGFILAACMALYSFGWFNLKPNAIIALLLFTVTWFLIYNSAIKVEFQPKAQRTGVVLGLATLLFYNLFLYFKSMELEIGMGLILLYLFIKVYRFNNYIKTYLIPYDIIIISNEKKGEIFHVSFTVLFAEGYFKTRFYNAIGHLESKNEFTQTTLRSMLTLTEINKFLQPQNATSLNNEFVHNYLFFFSLGEKITTNNEGEYSVIYRIIPDN